MLQHFLIGQVVLLVCQLRLLQCQINSVGLHREHAQNMLVSI